MATATYDSTKRGGNNCLSKTLGSDPFADVVLPKRFLFAHDCVPSHGSGVRDSINELRKQLEGDGHEVMELRPTDDFSFPLPFYPQVRVEYPLLRQLSGFATQLNPLQLVDHPLAKGALPRVGQTIREFDPDYIHIFTPECGIVGLQTLLYCVWAGLEFSASVHTNFPEYAHVYGGIPEQPIWSLMRSIFNQAQRVMTRSESFADKLRSAGIENVSLWHGSVDIERFSPGQRAKLDLEAPIYLWVGRLADEKSPRTFLDADIARGTKVVVGTGPLEDELREQYPNVIFTGWLDGEELVQWFRNADVLAMTSLTETFGRVTVQALATGLPVAGEKAPGTVDIINDRRLGALRQPRETFSQTLERAMQQGDPAYCVERAQDFSVQQTTAQFLENLIPVGEPRRQWYQQIFNSLPFPLRL